MVCPRCNRHVEEWPLARPDSCAPKNWHACIRTLDAVERDWRTMSKARFDKAIARITKGGSK